MRPSIKISLLFVGIWILGKMIFFWGQIFQEESGVKFLVMWNMLCLLSGMSIGTLLEKRKEVRTDSSALGDIKNAMSGGVIYTVLVASFMYLYYSKIDPAYNERQIAQAETVIQKALDDPKQLAEIKNMRPEYEAMSTEEIFKDMQKNPRAMFSAGATMTLSLLSMLVLSTLNAVLLTVIYRRVLFKQGTF